MRNNKAIKAIFLKFSSRQNGFINLGISIGAGNNVAKYLLTSEMRLQNIFSLSNIFSVFDAKDFQSSILIPVAMMKRPVEY